MNDQYNAQYVILLHEILEIWVEVMYKNIFIIQENVIQQVH